MKKWIGVVIGCIVLLALAMAVAPQIRKRQIEKTITLAGGWLTVPGAEAKHSLAFYDSPGNWRVTSDLIFDLSTKSITEDNKLCEWTPIYRFDNIIGLMAVTLMNGSDPESTNAMYLIIKFGENQKPIGYFVPIGEDYKTLVFPYINEEINNEKIAIYSSNLQRRLTNDAIPPMIASEKHLILR